MYLKQIEIHGFKSFANNTVLNFERGINGVVGPNGSGKSNIADAVRWVLGERSMKQLRGAETQDVIFAGTELKKALGFAYVSLIIDNTDKELPIDYNEVQVSRRLYRNGESEYKLNGADCRLKDIVELFYDTGIGKEGYSIIGQGQIEKILSNKPEDRRELFDEAVGIVKYKRRKIIAEKKLEEERLNLSRVSDIINEIERQIGPLRKQAEAAKEYLGLKEDLLLFESNYFVREIESQSNLISDINEKLNLNKLDLKAVNEKKRAFNEKYLEIENQITKIDLEISELKDKISDTTALKENLKGQINVLREQINAEMLNNQGRIERENQIESTINSYINDIIENIKLLNSLKNQIELIKTNGNDLNDDDLKRFNKDIDNIVKCISDSKVKVITLFDNKFNFNELIDNQNENLDAFDSIIEDENKIELRDIENEIVVNNNKSIEINNVLTEYNNKLDKINNDILNTQTLFHTEETRQDAIKNMLEKNEGYITTVKHVLDNKNLFKGIEGSVADIIETNKEYETAIEIALGNNLQNIVTDSIETSKSIISYLKDKKLGRITTLPLTSINPRDNKAYKDNIKENGVIDLAYNLVKFDSKYDKLVEYLLGRCLVVDTYDNAKNIFNKSKSGLKIVTLQGELFNPGGAVSGGALRNSTNLIGRKREYDELNVKISELKNKIDNLVREKNLITEKYDINYNEAEKIREYINSLNIKKNTVSLNIINNIKLKYTNIVNKAEFTCSNVFKIIDNLTNIINEKNKYKSDDNNYSLSINDKEEKIKNFENEIIKVDNELNLLNNSVDEKNNEKNDNLSNRKGYYESKDEITTEQINLEHENNRLMLQLEKSNQKIEEITNQMLENYNLTFALAKEKYDETLGDTETIKQKLKEKRKIIQDLGPINENAIEEYKSTGERYELMTNQYNDIKQSEEMIAEIVDELDENMRTQFDINFAKIKTEFKSVFSELFGGGKADLELVEIDEKGVLDAGVSIIVQPPGKKLGNMMQLSGGEKSLTAIALLFAIQNLKPSPFCLLDEIEAALDESNVDRFAEYLNKLTNHTQFIIITHRRGTMEKCDRLYGITMQEKGITAIVSVDLVEEQLS